MQGERERERERERETVDENRNQLHQELWADEKLNGKKTKYVKK